MTPAGRDHRVIIIDQVALLGFGPETPGAILQLRQAAEKIHAE